MNSLAFTPAATYLSNDSAAQAYLATRARELQALKEGMKPTETGFDLGYVTVTRTATGWLVNNLPAIGFVEVQAYILAKYW